MILKTILTKVFHSIIENGNSIPSNPERQIPTQSSASRKRDSEPVAECQTSRSLKTTHIIPI